jgi:tetratricopeptide (TPR) repeat protein
MIADHLAASLAQRAREQRAGAIDDLVDGTAAWLERVFPRAASKPWFVLLDVATFVSNQVAHAQTTAGTGRQLLVAAELLASAFGVEVALPHGEAAASILARLAEASPSDAQAQRDLSASRSQLGNFYLRRGATGDGERAFESFEAALSIRERLAEANSNGAQAQRDLSLSRIQLGDLYLRRGAPGDQERALEIFEAALGILALLVKASPNDAQAQRDLSLSRGKLGDLYLRRGASGDGERALESYEAALAIDERLAKVSPNDAQAQRDLSVSHGKLGDFHFGAGDRERARESYEAALAIRERLVEASPIDAQARRDLSVTLERLARLLAAEGEMPLALARTGQALAGHQEIFDAAPSAETAEGLALALNVRGRMLLESQREEGVRDLAAAFGLLEQLSANGALAGHLKPLLAELRELFGTRGDTE